mgnify:CR=1 FL=1
MATNSTFTFFLALGCVLIFISCAVMLKVTSRAPRPSRRWAGMVFWAALGIQTPDSLLTYLFDSYPLEFATVRGSWHLIAIGTVGAVALAFWSVFAYVDGTLSGPPRRDPRDRHPR